MKDCTEQALRSILQGDGEIAPETIDRAIDFLKGKRDEQSMVHVMRYKDVLKHLNCHPRTLEYYIQKGYLKRVYGLGQRAIGISRESFIRFTQTRVER